MTETEILYASIQDYTDIAFLFRDEEWEIREMKKKLQTFHVDHKNKPLCWNFKKYCGAACMKLSI